MIFAFIISYKVLHLNPSGNEMMEITSSLNNGCYAPR